MMPRSVLLMLVLASSLLYAVEATHQYKYPFLGKSSHPSPYRKNSLVASNYTECEQLKNCIDCSQSQKKINKECFWCDSESVCSSIADLALTDCDHGWCSGKNGCEWVCEEPCETGWAPCSASVIGEILLMVIYGAILAFGAKMIGDGSELLLEIMDPGIIGGLVLPVLGAVPDAMIVVVSGAIGSAANAQTQLAVGMGTLAGSTIMLLTVPWSGSLLLARSDIRHGESVDRRLSYPSLLDRRAWTETGTSVDDDTPVNARIMLVTSLAYFIVQGVAFAYLSDPEDGKSVEKWFALAGFIVCIILLTLYCIYQIMNPKLQEKKIQQARKEYRHRLAVQTMLHLMNVRKQRASDGAAASSESASLLEEAPPKPVDVLGVGLRWKSTAKLQASQRVEEEPSGGIQADDDDDDDEFKGMTKADIGKKAGLLLLAGTLLVVLFSDPMVDVIDAFGDTVGIEPFYLSFVITPFCSNASELISSLMFAAKKKRKNSSLSFSQIYGACTMNNTFVLAVFFALISFRGLTWTYSAETLAIFVVTLAVGIPGAFLKTIRLYWAPIIILLYPLSIVFVWILENVVGWT